MVESEEMPRQPSRARSLDAFATEKKSKEPPERRLEPKGSATGDSLFGNFVKNRQDTLDFDVDMKVPLKSEGIKQSSSSSKMTNVRQRKQDPRSSGNSPDPLRPASMRSIKSRSRSPAVRSEDLANPKSPKEASPKVKLSKLPGSKPSGSKSPKWITSPRGVRKSHQKSPKNPRKSTSSKNSAGEVGSLSSCPGLEDGAEMADYDIIDDDLHDMPELLDDSVVRGNMEGARAGKQWNIYEDTPGGHAEEKIAVVPAIENDEQSGDLRLDDSDLLEEDDDINDDIIDDTDEHSLEVARSRRRNSLPFDPSAAEGSGIHMAAASDRFAPGFKNHDMWEDGAQLDKQLPLIQRSASADVSLISDTRGQDGVVSLNELGNSTFADNQQDYATPEEDTSGDDVNGKGEGNNSKTPATTKRSGGRRIGPIESVPNLEADSAAKTDLLDDGSRPLSVPEDSPLDSNARRKSKKKRHPSSSRPTTSRHEKKGSDSTGRSSHRQSASRPRKERDALHSRRQKKVPEVVPTSMGSDGNVRSPMSSSLTSTPNSNSFLSSCRSHQQNQSLQALRRHHSKNASPPKRRPNISLNYHVERHRDHPQQPDGDEHTLGASTISTNFSTTQRTRGDNTVSTRSLFQSERMSISETPRPPQRRSEGSDFEDSDNDGQRKPPQLPRRTQDDFTSELQDETGVTPEGIFSGKATAAGPLGSTNQFRTTVRRPSGEGDDMLAMINSTHQSGSSEDVSLSSDGSSFKRWHKENGKDLIVTKKNVPGHGEGAPHTKAFLQLNPGDRRVGVESEGTDACNRNTPMTNAIREVPPSSATNSNGASSGEQPVECVKEEAVPGVGLSERIYGVGQETSSPGDNAKKHKRKSRLGLFKRVASWKGAVVLKDEDSEH